MSSVVQSQQTSNVFTYNLNVMEKEISEQTERFKDLSSDKKIEVFKALWDQAAAQHQKNLMERFKLYDWLAQKEGFNKASPEERLATFRMFGTVDEKRKTDLIPDLIKFYQLLSHTEKQSAVSKYPLGFAARFNREATTIRDDRQFILLAMRSNGHALLLSTTR